MVFLTLKPNITDKCMFFWWFAEYVYTLKVDEKSDIYSFGVVLLELVTGRRPFEPEFGEAIDIAQWVRKKLQSKDGLMEVIDPRIKPDSNQEPNVIMTEIILVLKVALHCLAELPMQRPTMREVLQMLTNSCSSSSSSSLSSSFSKKCIDSPPDLISIWHFPFWAELLHLGCLWIPILGGLGSIPAWWHSGPIGWSYWSILATLMDLGTFKSHFGQPSMF